MPAGSCDPAGALVYSDLDELNVAFTTKTADDHPMASLLRAACLLMIRSGIAGVVVGDASAAAGWWLIAVFSALLLLTFVVAVRQADSS